MLECTSKLMLPANRGLFYAGGWHDGATGRRLPVTNPATGGSLGEVAEAGPEDVAAAITSAKRALPDWQDLPPAKRAQLLREMAAVLRQHTDELALLDAIAAIRCANFVATSAMRPT